MRKKDLSPIPKATEIEVVGRKRKEIIIVKSRNCGMSHEWDKYLSGKPSIFDNKYMD